MGTCAILAAGTSDLAPAMAAGDRPYETACYHARQAIEDLVPKDSEA